MKVANISRIALLSTLVSTILPLAPPPQDDGDAIVVPQVTTTTSQSDTTDDTTTSSSSPPLTSAEIGELSSIRPADVVIDCDEDENDVGPRSPHPLSSSDGGGVVGGGPLGLNDEDDDDDLVGRRKEGAADDDVTAVEVGGVVMGAAESMHDNDSLTKLPSLPVELMELGARSNEEKLLDEEEGGGGANDDRGGAAAVGGGDAESSAGGEESTESSLGGSAARRVDGGVGEPPDNNEAARNDAGITEHSDDKVPSPSAQQEEEEEGREELLQDAMVLIDEVVVVGGGLPTDGTGKDGQEEGRIDHRNLTPTVDHLGEEDEAENGTMSGTTEDGERGRSSGEEDGGAAPGKVQRDGSDQEASSSPSSGGGSTPEDGASEAPQAEETSTSIDPSETEGTADDKRDPSDARDNEDDEEEEEDGPIERVVVDYANKSAGALILENSPSMKGTSNLLNSDRDKYAIAPCEDKKFVVIGLSEDILVKQIRIANYERYSSHVRDFQILGSQTLGQWVDLGTYTAEPGNGERSFELRDGPSWARYLKFRFVSHYGVEHYCTVSQIKVHGSTMTQGFHEQWNNDAETAAGLDDGEDDPSVEDGGDSVNDDATAQQQEEGKAEEEEAAAPANDDREGVQVHEEDHAASDLTSEAEESEKANRVGESSGREEGRSVGNNADERRADTVTALESHHDREDEEEDSTKKEEADIHGAAGGVAEDSDFSVGSGTAEESDKSSVGPDGADPSSRSHSGAATADDTTEVRPAEKARSTPVQTCSKGGPTVNSSCASAGISSKYSEQPPTISRGREFFPTSSSSDQCAGYLPSPFEEFPWYFPDNGMEEKSVLSSASIRTSSHGPSSTTERKQGGGAASDFDHMSSAGGGPAPPRAATTASPSSSSSPLPNGAAASSSSRQYGEKTVTDKAKTIVAEASDAIKTAVLETTIVSDAVKELRKIIPRMWNEEEEENTMDGKRKVLHADGDTNGEREGSFADDSGSASKDSGGGGNSDRAEASRENGGASPPPQDHVAVGEEQTPPVAQVVKEEAEGGKVDSNPNDKSDGARTTDDRREAGGKEEEEAVKASAPSENQGNIDDVVEHHDASVPAAGGADGGSENGDRSTGGSADSTPSTRDRKGTERRTEEVSSKRPPAVVGSDGKVTATAGPAEKGNQQSTKGGGVSVSPSEDPLASSSPGIILSRRIPSASCLDSISYSDFKSKLIASRTGGPASGSGGHNTVGGGGGGGGGGPTGGHMEPIFKTLTDEIKVLHSNQAMYDQYMKTVSSCYQSVLTDMVSELDDVEYRQGKRLTVLEDMIWEMKKEKEDALFAVMFGFVSSVVGDVYSALKSIGIPSIAEGTRVASALEFGDRTWKGTVVYGTDVGSRLWTILSECVSDVGSWAGPWMALIRATAGGDLKRIVVSRAMELYAALSEAMASVWSWLVAAASAENITIEATVTKLFKVLRSSTKDLCTWLLDTIRRRGGNIDAMLEGHVDLEERKLSFAAVGVFFLLVSFVQLVLLCVYRGRHQSSSVLTPRKRGRRRTTQSPSPTPDTGKEKSAAAAAALDHQHHRSEEENVVSRSCTCSCENGNKPMEVRGSGDAVEDEELSCSESSGSETSTLGRRSKKMVPVE